MQLAENYYRNYEQMSTDDITKKYAGLNGREIAMSSNMMWRLNLDPCEQKKMVIINHVIHTKTATQYQDEIWGHFVPMGQMVKQMLDAKSVEEGNKQTVCWNAPQWLYQIRASTEGSADTTIGYRTGQSTVLHWHGRPEFTRGHLSNPSPYSLLRIMRLK